MVELSENQKFQILQEQIQDYMDRDDLKLLDGMEEEDYLRIGKAFLPKNLEPEYREEIFAIPGFFDFFSSWQPNWDPDFFQVIPPGDMERPPDEVNLYSSDLNAIDMKVNLTDAEREELEKALELWRTEQIKISKTLKSNLLKKLDGVVSIKESGWYRVRLRLKHKKQTTYLNAAFKLESGSSYPIEYMEYFIY